MSRAITDPSFKLIPYMEVEMRGVILSCELRNLLILERADYYYYYYYYYYYNLILS